jgi:hypothetical protein
VADIGALIDKLLGAAKIAAAIIPGTTDDVIVAAGGKLADLIGDLADKAPDARTQEQMQADRRALRAAVTAKANAEADRLEGKH